MRAGSGGDHQIIGSNGLALGCKLGTNHSVVFRATVIERQTGQRYEEAFEQAKICFDPPAVTRTVEKLCLDHAAYRNLGGWMGLHVLSYRLAALVEQLNAGIGIEQIHGQNSGRDSKSPSGSRCKGLSCHCPATASK